MKNMKNAQSMKVVDAIRQRQLCISDSSSAGESNRLEGAAQSAGLTMGTLPYYG